MPKSLIKKETPDLKQRFTAKLLGEAIRARRTQSGLRLEDAALLTGVAKQTFMRIEHGSAQVSLGNVLKVMAGLGMQLQISPWKESNSDDW